MQRSVISLPISKWKLGPIGCIIDMGITVGT
ncbi:hypothetical protein PVAP13_2NG559092 [Panicum virgatum]|uniref:Uncharacterized protein n=1 Tax=Panicum virgatum TaxID=38727 RepID=A0A8T0VFD4_PANVG|nr:hypothetical protein PVAP13_2NG559092 [Panicum virgatum]